MTSGEQRTIYVWYPPISGLPRFEMQGMVPPAIMDHVHGLSAQGKDVTPFEAPAGLFVYERTPLDGFGGLFGDAILREPLAGRSLPDLMLAGGYPLVSARMRDALVAREPDGGHGFLPCLMRDQTGAPLKDMKYFHFWCGRRLFVKTKGDRDYDFATTMPPGNAQTGLLGNWAQALFASQQPVWIYLSMSRPIYFNQEMFACLKGKGLKGLDEFSEPGGRYS